MSKLILNQEALFNFISNLTEQRSGRVYEDKGYAWMLCPFHQDSNPSLRVNLRTGHFHCMACGETGSVVKLWQKIQNYDDVERAKQDLVSLRVFKPSKPKEEAVYHYYDREGWLLFRKRKLRHPDGSKTFIIEHYDFENEVWKTGKPKDCPPALYNYDAVVLARHEDKPIFLVEGEKDVDTLKSLGFLATTSGGANDWKTELAGEFAGLDVVLIPDNDPAGWQWLIKIGTDLLGFAREVRWIDLKEEAKKFNVDFPEKGDITDFLELVGGDPVEAFGMLDTKKFEPEALKEYADTETLLSSGLFLTKEAFEELSNIEFLFDGFLPWGYAVVLSSEPGAGKSWLALALAREAIKKGVKVVYLDGDNPLPYIKDNLEKFDLHNALGKKLFYLSRFQKELCIASTDDSWRAVKNMLRTIGKAFIIVDTLGSMSKGFDPNSDRDMREVLSELKAIRDAGHTVLILHHIQKYADGNDNVPAGQKYRGSAVIKADSDGLYFLQREGSSYVLHAGKLRFMGEQKLRLTLNQSGLIIEADQTSKKLKEAMKLLALLENGKEYKQKQIIEWAKYKLDFGRDKVRELLNFLEERGLIASKSVKGGIVISKVATQTITEEDDESYEDDLSF